MIAAARPPRGLATALGELLRLALEFAADVAWCVLRMLLPAFCSAAALGVISLASREFALQFGPLAGGYAAGVGAMCVVLGLLAWAGLRHRWWSP